jgi:hypothetical protein
MSPFPRRALLDFSPHDLVPIQQEPHPSQPCDEFPVLCIGLHLAQVRAVCPMYPMVRVEDETLAEINAAI